MTKLFVILISVFLLGIVVAFLLPPTLKDIKPVSLSHVIPEITQTPSSPAGWPDGKTRHTPIPTPTSIANSVTVTKNVMVIDFNPVLENQGSIRLRTYKSWNDPISLETQFIRDIQAVSGGYLQYRVVERLKNLDIYPTKSNGYVFTDDTYLAAINQQDDNARAIINYNTLLSNFAICDKANRGEIDEVWLWGAPWFGYWEAVMAGPGSYNTNAPPITGTSCTRKVHILGFSYERGIAEMLEDFGHRVEGTMRSVMIPNTISINDWDRFTKIQIDPTGRDGFPNGCGTVHRPFNAVSEYDWSNPTSIPTTCRNWNSYPPAPTVTQSYSCTFWGCSGYGYLKFWLENLPRNTRQQNGIWNNWWKYIADAE